MDNLCTNTLSFPADSLGRQIGIAEGFASYTEQSLVKMKNDLNLYMELSELKFCKNYYHNNKQNSIALSLIYLLDSIVKGSRGNASNANLTSIKFESKWAADTYSDLFSKHTDLCGGDPTPLSPHTAALVVSNYIKKTGAYPAPAPRLNFLRSKNTKLAPETAFVMVSPTDEAGLEDYYKNFSAFISAQGVKERIFLTKQISKKGIAFALSEMADGIYADIFSIPQMPNPPEVSHLATEAHGRIILAISKQDIPALSEIAAEHSLSLAYFAKAIDSNKFILLKRDHISLSVDMSLIRSLGHTPHTTEALVLSEEDDSLKTQRLAIIQRDNTDISICEAKFYSPCFVGALNTALDSLLPLCAGGADIRDISVTLKYVFPENDSVEQLGADLSCVLGAYRLLCELCVPNDAVIEYTDTSAISFCAVSHTRSRLNTISDRFSSSGTAVYLLSYNTDQNGIPDFESLRNMLRFHSTLLSAGAVKSAKFINGKLSDTLDEMKGATDIVFEADAYDILNDKFRGFIIESCVPLNTGILLGSVISLR